MGPGTNHQMEKSSKCGESPVVVRFYPLENSTCVVVYAANIERTMLHSPTKYYKLFPFTQAFNSRLLILLVPSKSSLNLIQSLLNPMKSLEIILKSQRSPIAKSDVFPPPFFCLPIFSKTALTTSMVPSIPSFFLGPSMIPP